MQLLSLTQPTLEKLQGWRLSSFRVQPVPMLAGCWGRNIFFIPSLNLSCLHLHCFLPTVQHYEEFGFAILMTPSQILEGPVRGQSLLSSGWASPASSGIQLPTISPASAELAVVYWCTQLYSLTWQISTLPSCPCVVFVHLSSGFSLLKDCSVTQGFLEYVCLQSRAWKQILS